MTKYGQQHRERIKQRNTDFIIDCVNRGSYQLTLTEARGHDPMLII